MSISNYKLSELIDVPSVQQMFELLYRVAQIPNALIDMEGNILIGAGWQTICTEFHRKNPKSEKLCIESDTHIRDEIAGGEPYCVYECPLGLVDSSCPVIIEGEHIGNVFTGQMLHTPLTDETRDRFQKQAQQYGYDEKAYLEALEKVPVFPLEQHQEILKLLTNISEQLANSALVKLRAMEQTRELQESERNFSALTNQSSEGISVCDREGNYTFVNQAFSKMVGWSEAELLGMKVFDLAAVIPKEPTFNRILGGEEGVPLPVKLKRKDGTIFHAEVTGKVLELDSKVHLLGTVRDISERIEAEAALRTSEAQARLIYDTLSEGVSLNEMIFNDVGEMIDYKILEVNPAFFRITGLPEATSIAGTLASQMYGMTEESITSHWKVHRLATETQYSEIVNEATKRTFGVMTSPYVDNKFITSFHDITERKQAEENLKKSHHLLNRIAEMVPGVVYQYRLYPDGTSAFPYASPGIWDIYEVTPEEVKEHASPVFTRIHPEDYDFIVETINESARTLINYQSEFRVILPEQGIRWRHCDAKPEKLEDGSVLWYGVITDITDRKEAETARSLLESQLNQSHKLEAVGTMVGGISHELNNILQSIFLYSDLVQTELPDNADLQNNFRMVIDGAKKARDIVRQILIFSRKTKIDMKPQLLHELVLEALALETASLAANVTVNQDIDVSCGPVVCDRTQFHQIILNLCNNAQSAMDEQGGDLTVSLKPVSARIGEKRGKTAALELKISDTGRGIEAEELERIFDPFYTTKEVGRGTGLGLSVIHGIVEMMQGSISVKSQPGKGTTFTILFPVAEPLLDNSTPASTLSENPPLSRSILLVDDQITIRDATQIVLKQKGFAVDCASDGQQALDIFVKNQAKYDLVITDLSMPKLSGLELTKGIRQVNSEIPIILSTGKLGIEDEKEYLNIGLSGFIQKPWTAAELIERIRQTVK